MSLTHTVRLCNHCVLYIRRHQTNASVIMIVNISGFVVQEAFKPCIYNLQCSPAENITQLLFGPKFPISPLKLVESTLKSLADETLSHLLTTSFMHRKSLGGVKRFKEGFFFLPR